MPGMPRMPSPGSRAFDMHMAGMQVTFLLSCALLATALSVMAAEIRRATGSPRRCAKRRCAMSISARSASSRPVPRTSSAPPLLSMSLLVEELQSASGLGAQSRSDLGLLGRRSSSARTS